MAQALYIYNISNISNYNSNFKGDRYKNRSTSTFTLEPKIECCNKIQKFSFKRIKHNEYN